MSARLVGSKSSYKVTRAEPIASGRLTDIFLAEDEISQIVVVVKRFRDFISRSESLESFYNEISALASLQHPNILEIMDYGRGERHGSPYFLVLPFMEGGNLRSMLRGRNYCPPSLALPMLSQAAAGLDYAHATGIVHLDIKPENILLGREGDVKLADFGVARNFDTEDRVIITAVQETSDRMSPRGSSAYLSPEQLNYNDTSPTSDLYSFALVAYELLTGKLPFDVRAPLLQQMQARVVGNLTHPRTANPSLSDHIGTALFRALDPSIENRPPSASAFVRLLGRTNQWDVFLAHAGDDTTVANELYQNMIPQVRIFLDNKILRYGDNWDVELASAQRESLITVVLVSSKTPKAYYEREEIAAAIKLARLNSKSHRVVPIYLDSTAANDPPYGLTIKHGMKLFGGETSQSVAKSLVELVNSLLAES